MPRSHAGGRWRHTQRQHPLAASGGDPPLTQTLRPPLRAAAKSTEPEPRLPTHGEEPSLRPELSPGLEAAIDIYGEKRRAKYGESPVGRAVRSAAGSERAGRDRALARQRSHEAEEQGLAQRLASLQDEIDMLRQGPVALQAVTDEALLHELWRRMHSRGGHCHDVRAAALAPVASMLGHQCVFGAA